MSIEMSNGRHIPLIGFGTYKVNTNDGFQVLKDAILKADYRHIDTASRYENESQIGDVLQSIFTEQNKIKREDVFVTTKLWASQMHDPIGALKASLKRLQLDYVDLYLIHFPIATENDDREKPIFAKIPMHVVWRQMEECVKLGLTRAIGVSNFNFQLLNDMLCYAEIKPVCNQIELHPYLVQEGFVEWMKAQRIIPVAYCPLGRPTENQPHMGKPFDDPIVRAIAKKHEVTPGQVLLAWGLARGHVVIPRTGKIERSRENLDSLKLKLTAEEVQAINKLDKGQRINDPESRTLFGKVPLFA